MPGLQSVASASDTPAASSRAASGYGERVQNSTPGSSVATVVSAPRPARRRRRRQVGAVIDAGRAELDRQLYPRSGAELVAVHAQAEAGRCGRLRARSGPRRRRRRAANAARRRRRSSARTGARPAASARSTRSTYPARSPAYSAGTTWAPRNVVSVVNSAGDPQCPDLVGNGQAVAALDLHGRRALSPHLGDARRQQPRQLVVAGGAGRGDGAADATAVVRLAGHPGRELRAPVAGEDQVAVASRRSREMTRPPRSIRRRRRERRAAGPIQAIMPSSTTHGRVGPDAEPVRRRCRRR